MLATISELGASTTTINNVDKPSIAVARDIVSRQSQFCMSVST